MDILSVFVIFFGSVQFLSVLFGGVLLVVSERSQVPLLCADLPQFTSDDNV